MTSQRPIPSQGGGYPDVGKHRLPTDRWCHCFGCQRGVDIKRVVTFNMLTATVDSIPVRFANGCNVYFLTLDRAEVTEVPFNFPIWAAVLRGCAVVFDKSFPSMRLRATSLVSFAGLSTEKHWALTEAYRFAFGGTSTIAVQCRSTHTITFALLTTYFAYCARPPQWRDSHAGTAACNPLCRMHKKISGASAGGCEPLGRSCQDSPNLPRVAVFGG